MTTHTALTQASKVITLGGGCFWCTEAVFVRVKGVLDVESGYCNGHTINPTYAQVCEGDTGHNEVVRLTYDPSVTSLRELLEIFFVIHDPTTLNRQGNDAGTQYRSGIYWRDEADRAVAQQVLDDVNAELAGRVVTELQALANYSAAEDYHQDYFEQHPNQGYCAFVVAPKVQKFVQTFADKVNHG
ncbi:MAG: peptide-methionine (S)-S-oxide reductase [Burkholderiales bacterium 35-55-47]|jgi:peptide-methionine (S)-S-oxide reductase|uniref:peptide-methionine (S)-S-oxide reductase MsrA n=1 Tax=Limnohabitans sp. TaxID=1907725 RepID=UPI000BCA142F|nr:peptide-methionine (S)-S-oxide reductase MsrA [Limnohabitans sp.]OYY19986.1 MAG: peptide-methionine (S)-S-oxide reductase [Burkholderiales bacterium 35-55-47]OYZ74404.1 MAG: peptide-methionine (S)-S-oxide reductase [Burkholderiales bacterium 24-55-52]OZB01705.1 MAG: peptide-methionine (S)-S-oxide reductase [Burkholderiales bacterium 39-55-53]HQR86204.1 peptide-methionine (S)-S-oxide reductase MsrA [Limnohabitans sp.]HQS25879.1 peptide-methionine (S)-S-oxide reductase MsrA [Limnohabitans sp.